MAEATKYRLKNAAGPFPQGMILTEHDVVAAGADFDWWMSTKTLVKATEEDEQVEGAETLLDDAAMKAEIERRIREEGVTKRQDQDRIAAEVSRQWGDLRQERHEAIAAELEKTTGQPDRGGAKKPGTVPPRAVSGSGPTPPPGQVIAGRPLSAYDGKSDKEVRDMIPGNDNAKDALVKEIHTARKSRDESRGK